MRVISTVKYLVLVCVSGLIWGSCNLINPVEPTPVYIHIDSFQFVPNGAVHPAISSSHNITAVWAYYNNNLIGEFDLPVTFPVITDGTGTGRLQVFPGIAVDGRNADMDIYAFYKPDTSLVITQAQLGKTVSFTPTTTYYNTIKPYVLSDFAIGTPIKFGLAEGNDSLIRTVDDSLIYEGNGGGSIYLSAVGDSSTDSSAAFVIPSGPAYIEFNYKGNLQFYVGLTSNITGIISSTPYYLAGINGSDHWQKFYLNVKAFALQYPGNTYNFYIKTVLPPGQATGRVSIDNIQLITF